jgi:hypothetical protein
MIPRRLVPIAALSLAVALFVGGCGGETTQADHTVTVTRTVTHADVKAPKRKSALKDERAAAAATIASTSEFVACDPNISVRAATTTCPFAQNVFYEYWVSGQPDAIRAYSPAAKTTYAVTCAAGQEVRCSAGDGAQIRFPQAAINAYTEGQATTYAAKADIGPQRANASVPTGSGPAAADSTDDTQSSSDASDSDFCTDHDCIPNYDEGTGDTAMCADGTYTHSGGIQGACSHHGGLG